MTGDHGWQVPTTAHAPPPLPSPPPAPPASRRGSGLVIGVLAGLLGGLIGAGVTVGALAGRAGDDRPAAAGSDDLESLVESEVAASVDRSVDRAVGRALEERMEDIAAQVSGMLSIPPEVSHLTEMVDLDGVAVELPVGACLGDLAGEPESLDAAVAVDCEGEHLFEVYALSELDDGAFPGDARFDQADQACYDAFADAIGTPYEESPLEFTALPPSQSRWREGERTVTCVVHDPDAEPLTGSSLGQGA